MHGKREKDPFTAKGLPENDCKGVKRFRSWRKDGEKTPQVHGQGEVK